MSQQDKQLTEVSLRAQIKLCKEQHDACTKDALQAARDGRIDQAREMYSNADSWWIRYIETQRQLSLLLKGVPHGKG
jgi:hypothetical protein